jgi:hypothetical protein
MNKIYTTFIRNGSLSLILFLLSVLTLVGQTPNTFNYQAVLRNASGDILESTSASIQLVIHQGTPTGTTVYSEIHNTMTNEFGLVNLEIGSITPATFTTIDWSAGPYFVEVIVNGTAMGASELLTVPYALYAKTAESSNETDPVFMGSSAASITVGDITKLGNLSGTNTGDQDISGIATNASDIAALQGEQAVQNSAIALNTAKVGLTPSQETILANTSGVNTGDQDGSETRMAAGTNTSVTGLGTIGSPYRVNVTSLSHYRISSAVNRTIANSGTTTGHTVQILQMNGIPAGTYAVYFSCPVSNTSTSSNGINLAWSIQTNSGTPTFPMDGVSSSFIPATGWTANYIFGQSGFMVVNLSSTGSIDLVVGYYGSLLSGAVTKVGTAHMIAIRL